jgi:broad specificity phosphatase PhoE
MNRVFYIFRHGETDWNKERRCQGHTNTQLNELGFKQALDLSHRLSNYPIEYIISSDLDRALSTAKIVAQKIRVSVKSDPRLREMSYGEGEGLTIPEIIEKYGEDFWNKVHSFKKSNEHIGFPRGETRLESRMRILNLIEDTLLNTKFQHIGISTHGGALRNILHSFLNEDHPILPIPNCVCYQLKYNETEKKFSVETNPI